MPAWLNNHLDDALNQCVNQAKDHARKKRDDFHSFASEDHATWVVMRALQRAGALGKAFGREDCNPTMLLWGVPVPTASPAGAAVRDRLLNILRNKLREREGWFTEPDVVLDFGSSVVVVEAKLSSTNERKPADYGGWNTYVNATAFASPELAVRSELYQLARNWRVAFELADGRPFTVVNLAPSFPKEKKERRSLAMLRASIATRGAGTLRVRTWAQVAEALRGEDWFELYALQRGLWGRELPREASPR